MPQLTQAQMNMLAAMGMPAPADAPINPNQFPPQTQQPPAAYVPPQPFQQQVAPAAQPLAVNQLNTKIQAGQGIPAALVGRSLGEVIEAMTRTATRIQQLERNPQAPQAQAPQAQQSQQQSNAQQIMNAGTQQQAVQTPAGMTIEQIQTAIQQGIANATMPQNITAVEQAVAASIPVYNDPGIRSAVQEIIGQLAPEHQLNRANWDQAIALVVGERTMKGQGIPAGFMAPTQQQAWTPTSGQQAPQAPQTFQPANVQTAFVEAPSNSSVMNGNRPPLTQQEAQIGRMLGLDPQVLSAHNQQAFN